MSSVPSGWVLTNITLDDNNSSGDIDTKTVTFNLEPGETIRAVFSNAMTGTIIVEKQTDPDGDPNQFVFTGDASGSISDNQQIVVTNLPPGTYSATEILPEGWTLTNITLDDNNSSGDVDIKTATFNLEAGETVKGCTLSVYIP